MSALIYAQKVSKTFGTRSLFKEVTFGVLEKDRIGVIGPNGAGKSTLLKILLGEEHPDQGAITKRQSLRIAYIPQQTDFSPALTVEAVLHEAADRAGITKRESLGRTYEVLGRTGFPDPSQLIAPLSGGRKKRLAIACGLIQEPDVLLLDEPTNHLDYEGLQWLEQLLGAASWAWVLVSHDRWLLDRVVNQVVELNSRYADGVLAFPGSYSDFVVKRGTFHQTQEQQARVLAGKVRREGAWLRQGPKARTTKAKYRVDTAYALQEQLTEVTNRLREEPTVLDLVGSGRKTKRLVAGEGLRKTFDGRTVFNKLDLVLSPGSALGILGENGSGKSTLLKILAKILEPDEGIVTYAEGLKVVYFDQHREALNPGLTLRQALSDNGHWVTHREKTMHVAAWAKQFRFQPEQLDVRVDLLSGGEQARALMARLMVQPADVLLVDEPTNDLDIPTREVLEDSLRDFPGVVVLVTHDRYMLSEVCSQFLGFDGSGGHAFFSAYEQWDAWRQRRGTISSIEVPDSFGVRERPRRPSSKKLSYREQQEYDKMEERILDAENLIENLRTKMSHPTVASNHVELQSLMEDLKTAEREVEHLYARWVALDAKRQEAGGR